MLTLSERSGKCRGRTCGSLRQPCPFVLAAVFPFCFEVSFAVLFLLLSLSFIMSSPSATLICCAVFFFPSCPVPSAVLFFLLSCSLCCPAVGELRTQKLKSHLVRTQGLRVLPLKPGVGQYIAVHATLTAREFLLANFYPFGPFTCIFPNLSRVFLVLAVAKTSSCVGPQNKIGHLAGCRLPC